MVATVEMFMMVKQRRNKNVDWDVKHWRPVYESPCVTQQAITNQLGGIKKDKANRKKSGK